VIKLEYEEKIIACMGCGKKIRAVVLKNSNNEFFLCQRCAKEESGGFDDE